MGELGKICTGCHDYLSLSKFAPHPTCKYGVDSRCRKCTRARSRTYYLRNRESVIKRTTNYYKKNKNHLNKIHPIKYEKNPKNVARNKLRTEIDAGRINFSDCEYPMCNVKAPYAHAHHWDYNNPLEVTWLCRKHHVLADRVRRLIDKKNNT